MPLAAVRFRKPRDLYLHVLAAVWREAPRIGPQHLHAAVLEARELDDVQPERAADHLVQVVAPPDARGDESGDHQAAGVDAQDDDEGQEEIVHIESDLKGRPAQSREPADPWPSLQPRQ